ncbi:dihydrofolate reductase [Balneolales bacterium ANBcel1]|nr:dihydrofolate reductase [Balneolales bacterium ANBcel1]
MLESSSHKEAVTLHCHPFKHTPFAMIVSMIAAHDPNLVIGKGGSLPWHIPEDLAHFRQRTTGHTIVMGRGVFEEIGEKPLPKRRNLVLSRSRSYENVETCRSVADVLAKTENEQKIYIIGGSEIYNLFFPLCNRLEITLIHDTWPGDVFFPEYRNQLGSIWKEVFREERDELTFVDYDRVSE